MNYDDSNRNLLVSIGAGCVFGAAWWLVIDAGVIAEHRHDPQKMEFVFLLPPIFLTIALVLMNLLQWEDISGDSLDESRVAQAKCIFFTCLLVGFTAVGGSVAILVKKYSCSDCSAHSKWGGEALVICDVLIFASALLFRLGRSDT